MFAGQTLLQGVSTYYETHGAGEPLALLHGGLGAAGFMSALTLALSSRYKVFVPERRGHGHTPDTPGPYSYEVFALDTIAFLEAMQAGPTHLVGLSDGAVIAALVALARPDLVRSVVLYGRYLHQDGARPEALALFAGLTVEAIPPALLDMHTAVSPDGPDHFPVVLEKTKALLAEGPRISTDQLEKLKAPTLVMVADDDVMTEEYAVAMFRALPNGQFAVIPGASHLAYVEKPDLCAALILDFLSAPRATRLMPIMKPNANATLPPMPTWSAGDRVEHGTFGHGTVLGANDQHVLVHFDGAGQKKLSATLVTLTASSTPAPSQGRRAAGLPRPKATLNPTDAGYENEHQQKVLRQTSLSASLPGQRIYVLLCGKCNTQYGAHGGEIALRRCPYCMGGPPGLNFKS